MNDRNAYSLRYELMHVATNPQCEHWTGLMMCVIYALNNTNTIQGIPLNSYNNKRNSFCFFFFSYFCFAILTHSLDLSGSVGFNSRKRMFVKCWFAKNLNYRFQHFCFFFFFTNENLFINGSVNTKTHHIWWHH